MSSASFNGTTRTLRNLYSFLILSNSVIVSRFGPEIKLIKFLHLCIFFIEFILYLFIFTLFYLPTAKGNTVPYKGGRSFNHNKIFFVFIYGTKILGE